jgi:hypothetical protein
MLIDEIMSIKLGTFFYLFWLIFGGYGTWSHRLIIKYLRTKGDYKILYFSYFPYFPRSNFLLNYDSHLILANHFFGALEKLFKLWIYVGGNFPIVPDGTIPSRNGKFRQLKKVLLFHPLCIFFQNKYCSVKNQNQHTYI